MENGHIPDAASKTYYAMFYATNPAEQDKCLAGYFLLKKNNLQGTKAILTAEGINVVKHSAVESAFGYL